MMMDSLEAAPAPNSRSAAVAPTAMTPVSAARGEEEINQ